MLSDAVNPCCYRGRDTHGAISIITRHRGESLLPLQAVYPEKGRRIRSSCAVSNSLLGLSFLTLPVCFNLATRNMTALLVG